MNLFDPDHLGTITRLAATKDGWVGIYADGKRVARVPREAIERLGIAEGGAWTRPLDLSCALAAETCRAKNKAVSLIRVRPRGSGELTARLIEAKFSQEAAAAATAELAGEGLVDDTRLAAVTTARATEKGMSTAAMNSRLTARGLAAAPPPLPGSELERAVEAARNRAGKIPESLDAPKRSQRLLSALARLGYDEETAREAVQRVLGFQDE